MGQAQHSIRQRRRGAKGPSQRELAELRALWGTMPVKDIAARFAISRVTAWRWHKRVEDVSHLRTMFHISGYTLASLASALGCTPERILGWVKRGWLERKHGAAAEDSEDDGNDGEPVDFSDTGVLRLWVQHPHAVFPHGMSEEQSAWLAGMQRTAHQGRVRESA